MVFNRFDLTDEIIRLSLSQDDVNTIGMSQLDSMAINVNHATD